MENRKIRHTGEGNRADKTRESNLRMKQLTIQDRYQLNKSDPKQKWDVMISILIGNQKKTVQNKMKALNFTQLNQRDRSKTQIMTSYLKNDNKDKDDEFDEDRDRCTSNIYSVNKEEKALFDSKMLYS